MRKQLIEASEERHTNTKRCFGFLNMKVKTAFFHKIKKHFSRFLLLAELLSTPS
jgi:hypothetical protein